MIQNITQLHEICTFSLAIQKLRAETENGFFVILRWFLTCTSDIDYRTKFS